MRRTTDREMEPPSGVGNGFVDDWLLANDPAIFPDSAAEDQWRPRLNSASAVFFFCKVLWASPWSLWGLSIGVMGLLTGGGVQRSGRILEFWGGILPLFLKHFPFIAGSPVATFGHVVLGRCPRHLDACRPHQLIHVKQYEQWGPLFVPTYIMCWIVLWCVGKRPYYDNPFEREAFDKTG
jgi:hypothetical protein